MAARQKLVWWREDEEFWRELCWVCVQLQDRKKWLHFLSDGVHSIHEILCYHSERAVLPQHLPHKLLRTASEVFRFWACWNPSLLRCLLETAGRDDAVAWYYISIYKQGTIVGVVVRWCCVSLCRSFVPAGELFVLLQVKRPKILIPPYIITALVHVGP